MVSGHAEHPAGRKTKGTRGDAYRACRRGQEGAGGKAVKRAGQRVSLGIGGEGVWLRGGGREGACEEQGSPQRHVLSSVGQGGHGAAPSKA